MKNQDTIYNFKSKITGTRSQSEICLFIYYELRTEYTSIKTSKIKLYNNTPVYNQSRPYCTVSYWQNYA